MLMAGVEVQQTPGSEQKRFRHEAMLYSGLRQFLDGTVPFIREGIAGKEPVLVVVDSSKISALRAELGHEAERVSFADMAEVGRNPARIIPVWRRFVDENPAPGRPVRGIGEPIWSGRSPAELVECQAHETLLNLAFADGPGWSLLCPYDIGALPPEVVDEAMRSHPFYVSDGRALPSDRYLHQHPSPSRLDHPLPSRPHDAAELSFSFEPAALRSVRAAVRRYGASAGLGAAAIEGLVVAANEVATNSLCHGGGAGTLRLWSQDGVVVCEITDAGRITGPSLLGRTVPDLRQEGGRGLWLANQLCDLVQIRSSAAGTTIRLHMAAPKPAE
jgi:anti-sigma regulatory factor (Ser/Thr protein kinase)